MKRQEHIFRDFLSFFFFRRTADFSPKQNVFRLESQKLNNWTRHAWQCNQPIEIVTGKGECHFGDLATKRDMCFNKFVFQGKNECTQTILRLENSIKQLESVKLRFKSLPDKTRYGIHVPIGSTIARQPSMLLMKGYIKHTN